MDRLVRARVLLAEAAALGVNRPGFPGGSKPWKGWRPRLVVMYCAWCAVQEAVGVRTWAHGVMMRTPSVGPIRKLDTGLKE